MGVKKAGGPACVQILFEIKKHIRNIRAHYKLPKDVNGSIQRLTDEFQADPMVPPELQQLLVGLDKQLRSGIDAKKRKDVSVKHGWVERKKQAFRNCKAQMATFLQSMPSNATTPTTLSRTAASFTPTEATSTTP